MLMALGVPATVVQQHGLVSQESATAMGRAIRETLGADFGIGLTGVPGPTELEGKPMGLAYLALVSDTEVKEWQLRVPPRRITIKRRVSNHALIELCKLLTTSSTH
jgi:nicotinamide-nucleotide amidase